MPENALRSNFLEGDTVVGKVNNCVERAIYLVAKQYHTGDLSHLTKLFVGNLTYKLTTDFQGGQVRIYSDPLLFSNAMSVNQVFINKGDANQAIAQIEHYLSHGSYVLLRTITSRVPFFKRYDKNYQAKQSDYDRPGHVILLIWQDKDYIYYVDSPSDLHAENFIPFPDNPEVGMINKKDLMDSLHLLTNLTTINVSKEKLNDFMVHSHADHVSHVIRDSVQKYRSSGVEETTQGYTYTNKEALLFLISLTQGQPFVLNDEHKQIEQNKILIGLNVMQKRKELLRDYLIKDFPHESKSFVLGYLEKNIDAIDCTKMFMLQSMLKGSWLFDSAYTDLLHHIVRTEDDLYGALECYVK